MALAIVSFVVTGVVYLGVVPRLVAAGAAERALLYVVVGWIPYTIGFYALGRLRTSPNSMPGMRPADVGLVLVFAGVLVSLGLDSWGIPPEAAPEAHVLQAVAIFVGFALLGWGIGRRSATIERLDRARPSE